MLSLQFYATVNVIVIVFLTLRKLSINLVLTNADTVRNEDDPCHGYLEHMDMNERKNHT